MNLIFFVAALAAVSVTGFNLIRLLRLSSRVEKGLVFLLLAGANIVFSTYLLSLFSAISSGGYLVLQMAWAVVSWGVHHRFARRPQDGGNDAPGAVETAPQPAAVGGGGETAIPKWLLIGLLAILMLTAAFNFFFSIYIPPNNWDSMAYHLARVGFWIQQGSLDHFYTPKFSQNALPPNAEVLLLWVIIFLKSDILANLVQWFAYCGIGLTIFLISRTIGNSTRASMFAASIFLCMPMVIFQSTSTQNDLVVTFFTLAFFYFSHTGFKRRDNGRLILAGLAFGLAMGAKLTIFFMLPALGLAVLVFLRLFNVEWALFIRWCVLCLAGFFLLGSYNYFQNYKSYGHPVSPPEKIKRVSGKFKIDKPYLNALRLGYDAIDFSGLPEPIESYLLDLKNELAKRYLSGSTLRNRHTFMLFHPIRSTDSLMYNHEDLGYFGLLGFLLYLPAALWFCFRVIFKRKFDEKWTYAFIAVFFFIAVCFLQKYDPCKGRYFILSMAFLAPLAVSFVNMRRKLAVAVIAFGILFVSAFSAYDATFNNLGKPVFPVKSKRPKSIMEANTYQKRAWVVNPRMIACQRFLEEVVEPGSKIGVIFINEDWSYPFFRSDFSNSVVYIPRERLKGGAVPLIREYKLDYLFIGVNDLGAINSRGLVFSLNRRGRYCRVVAAPGRAKALRKPGNTPLLKTLWNKKHFVIYGGGVRFTGLDNIGARHGGRPAWGLPAVRKGFGPKSTIKLQATATKEYNLFLKLRTRLKGQALEVLVNNQPVRRFAVKGNGRFRTFAFPIKLLKGANQIVFKYSRWLKLKGPKKTALQFSRIRLGPVRTAQ